MTHANDALRMVAYIERHGLEATANANGTLAVLEHFSYGASEWTTIPATWTAVRDWLGY